MGLAGLLDEDITPMTSASVGGIVLRGGTMLRTARCQAFFERKNQIQAADILRKHGIDGLVVIGGDGSFRGARDLSQRGIPCVGLPGTIDNDIACCDYTIGYDTCMNTIMEMVDRIRDTAESHDRCMVVEVMGRRAGYLALNAGIAVGATAILIPEIEFDIQKDVIERMKRTLRTDKKHFLIIVAEGVGINVNELAKEIQAKTGVESRACVLGHVQRGGSPTLRDRVNASAMGYQAVCLLEQGKYNRIVGMKGEKLVDYPVDEALEMTKSLDPVLVDVCNTISI